MRAVAERVGVNERTVYRHFANERALRDAVMQRFEEEAGVDLSHMALGDIADVAAHVLRFVSAYPIEPRPPLDPTLAATNERRHDALLAAVAAKRRAGRRPIARSRRRCSTRLWAVDNYERLVGEWDLDAEQAIRGMTWVIESGRGSRPRRSPAAAQAGANGARLGPRQLLPQPVLHVAQALLRDRGVRVP